VRLRHDGNLHLQLNKLSLTTCQSS
jgi:hypothetical protein